MRANSRGTLIVKYPEINYLRGNIETTCRGIDHFGQKEHEYAQLCRVVWVPSAGVRTNFLF